MPTSIDPVRPLLVSAIYYCYHLLDYLDIFIVALKPDRNIHVQYEAVHCKVYTILVPV